ncbi:DegT/DnrJ/EryC1/StrS family aminotransferase [Halobacterium salinarum]|uniref:DegT/DnrJ/EryC1/StrS family aminotransferase n=1 Tax=Halobacterium salinarum TaxID=2242 RepID=UPI0025535139|nr:DegT/DnrJ/EryC1/StrS family aminotransferase [Halobacterium salinarum]MDL0121105.1 DegT/DnrJ/EryC1/StrS family aminotransferase [Halobacterium salinarum]MDL0135786.1 DegT/DnrJ/EryC1/StrS family aminotransferase [Halobacterium salinarum]MDL0138276.1 DegT/DnrJ/EryC1/StrS family aminotransferase [Halobacterium salinarum]
MIPIANPDLGESEIENVSDIIESGIIADGPQVRDFETAFAEYSGVEHAVATSNGTTALHTALEALELGTGDRVVTTPFSFIASSNAIRLAGAEPVFADIDAETFNLDPESVREIAETQDVDAILAVHLYGLPCDMDALCDIATEHDLALIEDCAQAHGATYNDQPVGSFGDVACFSFYPTKNMTTGEGGMLVTNDAGIAERAESFVNHGRPPEGGYKHVRVGHNFRMTSIAAAIGQVQLEKLPDFLIKRRENARRFNDGIDDDIVELPTIPGNRTHAYHQYTIRAENRDELLEHLQNRGVGVKVYYPKCIHQQPAYNSEMEQKDFHVAERAANEVVSLPVHPRLSDQDIETIINAVNDFGGRR